MRKVIVLLSTYNGEKYIEEQIKSILMQKGVQVEIVVRDDGSTDKTIEILEFYKEKGLINWYAGENLKPANSFMDLIYTAPVGDYYAFCDQDDFWLEDKLEIAVRYLEMSTEKKPALYYGRARLVDKDLNLLKEGRTSSDVMLDLKSAIINSNAIGCTMVFNKSLFDIVKESQPSYISMHDAWVHKTCIIFHGNIFFDDDVHVLYRQHGNNVIGSTNSVWKKIVSHYKSFLKKECIRSRTICSLIECYGEKMQVEDYEMCKLVADYKHSFKNRLKIVFQDKIKTNYLRRNTLFKIAILLKIF